MFGKSRPFPLEIHKFGPVTLVRCPKQITLDADLLRLLGDKLLSLLSKEQQRRFIFNFTHVQALTAELLWHLLVLHQRVVAAGGQLVFCQAGPFLAEIFKVVELPQIVRVYVTEQQAIRAYETRLHKHPTEPSKTDEPPSHV